jgi:hypothetical protein
MTLHKATRRSSWAKIWAQLSYLWVEVFRLVFLSSISELKYAVSFSNQKEEKKNQSFWISGQLYGVVSVRTVVVPTAEFSSHHNI